MPQFSLRSLFAIIFVAALWLGIAQTAGYVIAAGIVMASLVLASAALRRRRGPLSHLRKGSAIFALVALWFLAVDWSWFVADCHDCGYHENIYQYRVLGMPVRTQVRACQPRVQLILDDLGVPCEHRDYERWHNFRVSGLVLLTWPRSHDLYLNGDSGDYTDAMAAKVQRLGSENPRLAEELHDTAVREHNYEEFWQTIEDLTGETFVSWRPVQPPESQVAEEK